ncbi:MAG: hypothetical protein QM490_04055 [Candidatus Gracilibacteria bacterium]
MKKLLFSVFLFLSFTSNVNAGWYEPELLPFDLGGGNQGTCNGVNNSINDTGCHGETVPYQTYCFNSLGGTTPIGDNIPVLETISAVYVSTAGGPILSDNPSDNTNYDNTNIYLNDIGNGAMTCFYWDEINVNTTTYKLDDSGFDDFGSADGEEEILIIDFPLETSSGGITVTIDLDNSENGIDTIDFTMTFLDKTQLDQSGIISGSSVFSIGATSDITDISNIRTIIYEIDSLNISDFIIAGNTFNFGFKFYNSTIGDGIEIRNDFILQSLKYDVTFKGGLSYVGASIYSLNSSNPISNIPIKVKPLYTIISAGELTNSGFVEGSVQTGSIEIIREPTALESLDIDIGGLYILQSGTGSSGFTSSGTLDNSNDLDIVPDMKIYTTNYGTLLEEFLEGGAIYFLKTFFTLVGNSTFYLDDLEHVELYQYIKYTLDLKDVTYLAGALNGSSNMNLETLKIYGITNIDSDKQVDLVENQDGEDIHNLDGEINKSVLKRDIRESAISTIKFIDTEDETVSILDLTGYAWDDFDNGGKVLGDILYYDNLNGGNVELGSDFIYELIITGVKTIVIKGGNLYIKSNMINDTGIGDHLLGLIVLKDESGKGGKIYIDTDVVEVDAIIYADKSVISYNKFYGEIDGNIDSAVMQNQLYIYGTVFSENTIGGSRLNPPVCPFYTESIPDFDCDVIEAQKYDFNYLRAGFEDKYNDGYADYPIIIKYNSAMQITPPPLFTN